MTVGAYLTLKNALPGVEIMDADIMTDRVRMVKSPLEIQQYRKLWDLSKAAVLCFIEELEPGKTQRQVAAAVAAVLRAGGCFDDMTAIEEGSRRGLPKDVPLRCDDLVGYHMEICGPSGHWTETDTTCVFRDITDMEHRRLDTELRAYEKIRENAKPGTRLGELSTIFDRMLLEDGWELVEQTVHFDFHSHGMDDVQWPWYSPKPDHNQDIAIEENMVLCYHPQRNTDPPLDWGPRITDNFLITANGGERLSGDWDLSWRLMK
jgi:Xaa-Pro aminopeptidase